jgi:probable O-glycosylation ligase (exosortase A-associated)
VRDYLILGVIMAGLPVCFLKPWIGCLYWYWIAYMNPHRLSWGIAYNFPVAQLVAVATLLGVIATKRRDRIPMERETVIVICLWIVFTISTLFSIYPADAWPRYSQVSKILLITFVTLMFFADRKRLRYLLLVTGLSIGFFGFKGGLFSLLTGGNYRIYGPPGSFIEDNNDFALAALMVIPIIFYLAREETKAWRKWGLRIVAILSVASVIFTYSRGGFLGLAGLSVAAILKSKRKVVGLVALVVIVYAGFSILPAKWFERIHTIGDYREEGSAQGRINAWHFAWNLAMDRPLFGGGFDTFAPDLFWKYAPDPLSFHDAHSIYFEILGEQGFLGLGLFLGLLASSMASLRRLRKSCRDVPGLRWIADYSDMIQLSLVAYMVSGAFLGRAYFDLFYNLIAVVIVLKVLARREKGLLAAPVPA